MFFITCHNIACLRYSYINSVCWRYNIDVWPFAKACKDSTYTTVIAVCIDTDTEKFAETHFSAWASSTFIFHG